MFKRTVLTQLTDWAQKQDRRPLILRGARQVGKTTAVDMFSEDFDQYLRFDLELKKDREIFDREMSVQETVEAMFYLRGEKRSNGKILIFIDEIQNSPQALTLLRYFYEQAPELHVIGAGSLLEVMLDAKKIRFPVGRVEFLYIYPLVFEEFLDAVDPGSGSMIVSGIPLPEYAHDRLLELFHRYTMIGGMPAVVRSYIEEQDLNALASVYEGLIISFIDDAAKYANNATMRAVTKHIIETAPFEAGKRIKFAGFGRSNYRSREVGESLRALERAMLLQILYPSTSTGLPVTFDKKKSPRLQFLDTGLMNYAAGLQKSLLNLDDLTAVYQGTLAEHIVGQQLQAMDLRRSRKITFWVRQESNTNAEVDFLFQHKKYALPVEVKSGKSGSLRSLHEFVDRAPHNYAVRLYAGRQKLEEAQTPRGKPYYLLNLPYYLGGQLPVYVDWMLEQTC